MLSQQPRLRKIAFSIWVANSHLFKKFVPIRSTDRDFFLTLLIAMPTLSQRALEMPASPIRKLVPFADKAKARGTHVFHLNIGQPDIHTPELAWEALRNMDRKVLEYSPSGGIPSYRRKLCAYYKSRGINISEENLIVTTGGSEAILFGILTCLDAGDEIIIPEPFYANYNGFGISGGIKVKPITADIKNGFALPPMEEFEKLIGPKTKAIIICNPNNPTGYAYSQEELEVLRKMVIKHDLFLFADEVYREFCYDSEHHSVLNLEGLEQHAVVVDSVSKRYSACGARIGALVSKNTGILENAMKFAQARLSPPTLAQVAAEAMIDVEEKYFTDVLSEYQRRRDITVKRLNAMEGVFCPEPKGAFYCMAELPVENAERFSQWLLEEFSLNDQTVMVAPGAGFYNSEGLGKSQVRIAYVLNGDDLNKAMDCLEAALKKYKD